METLQEGYLCDVVGKAVMGQIFLGVLPYSPVSIIPSGLHTHTHSSTIEATILAPNSTEQSPYKKETKSSADQEIPRILRNANVHF